MDLTDHVAFVTGASRGIGRACAIAFARQGTHVALAARSPGDLEQTADLCREHDVEALTVETDVSDPEDVQAAINYAVEEFDQLNFLVNNAGRDTRQPIDRADVDEWKQIVDVNLMGTIYATRYASPHLKLAASDEEQAAVVNIASIAGQMSFPEGGAYCSSKHGVVGLGGSAFEDLREYGIKVSTLSPGYVNTGMVSKDQLDADKMIQPEDIAQTVLFVARYPDTGCPTDITIRPQRTPYLDG